MLQQYKKIGNFEIIDTFLRPSGPMCTGLINMINFLSQYAAKKMVCIEVGSYRGESAELMLSTNKIEKIYCVDPWENYIDYEDNVFHANMKNIEKYFDERFKNKLNVIKFKGTLNNFYKENINLINAIDFIYLDARHEEVYIKNDLFTAFKFYPKIAICGHDFNEMNYVLEKYIGKPDKIFEDTSWIKFITNCNICI